MFLKYVLFIFLFNFYIIQCQSIKNELLDAHSKHLKNEYCNREFVIKFKVITNDKNLIYKNVYSIDIELLHIYKGLYNESNLDFNYFTKLFFEEENSDACMHSNQLNSLAVNHVFILIGNFKDERLFVKECDYLKRIDLMRTKDLNLLRKGIECKKE